LNVVRFLGVKEPCKQSLFFATPESIEVEVMAMPKEVIQVCFAMPVSIPFHVFRLCPILDPFQTLEMRNLLCKSLKIVAKILRPEDFSREELKKPRLVIGEEVGAITP